MNPVPKAVAFREWLLGHEEVQKQIYGWMVWLGQVFGLRYSEWIAAEWPTDGLGSGSTLRQARSM